MNARPGEENGFSILRGLSRFFERNGRGRARITMPGAEAGVHGTEFVIQVDDQNRIRIWVTEGRVGLTNDFGSLSISDGQGLLAEPGKAPVPTGGFNANNILQWFLYFPAVLDLQELPLTSDEQQTLGDSLTAYAQGDLLQALQKYPAGRQPQSDAENIYYAALILSVGEVARAEELLGSLPGGNDHGPHPAAGSSAAPARRPPVKRQDFVAAVEPETATELLAASYYQQSLAVKETSLRAALRLASAAKAKSPQFGFASARVAELDSGFGHTKRGRVGRLAKCPGSNSAQCRSRSPCTGFCSRPKIKSAKPSIRFTHAIAVDPGLGNAWLGRGLCRIRQGDRFEGQDLLTAAALEPQRAVLRSYLGKAYGNERDFLLAPTESSIWPNAWIQRIQPHGFTQLCSNSNKTASTKPVRRSGKIDELNDNRSVYRSQFLLDQDRAVRSANTGRHLPADAGMLDVSIREATRGRELRLRNRVLTLISREQLHRCCGTKTDQSSLRDSDGLMNSCSRICSPRRAPTLSLRLCPSRNTQGFSSATGSAFIPAHFT